MSKFCELCGRELSDAYSGSVCPVCKQDFEERKTIHQEEQHNSNPASTATLNSNQNSEGWNTRTYSSNPPDAPNQVLSNSRNSNYTAISYQEQTELDKLASLETTSAVVWLIIGILQVLSLFLILVGAWNIYVSTTRFRRATDIKNGHPDIPNVVDKEIGMIILFIAINLIFGAVIGVIAPFLDLYIRDTIIKKRYLFERTEVHPLG